MSTHQIITVKVLLEAADDTAAASLRRWVIPALEQSCKYARGGAVVVALYDDDGEFLGMKVSGNPSGDIQDLISEIYDGENNLSHHHNAPIESV